MEFDRILEGYYDIDGNVLKNYDLTLGKIELQLKETIHHDAIQPVEEKGHWEILAEYPNGGKDIKWVVDVKKVEAEEAWDEKVGYNVFIPYTEEELQQFKLSQEDKLAELEQQVAQLTTIINELKEGLAK